MNFKNQLFAILFLVIGSSSINAQDKVISGSSSSGFERKIDKISAGFGLGLDYGGIGVNFTAYPVKYVGLFAGAGSNFNGLGYNIGAKFRYPSTTAKISPFLAVMYGYNAVVIVQNSPQYDKTFYGITYGLGMDFRLSAHSNNYFSFGLFLPQRADYDAYIESLETNNGVKFDKKPAVIQVSLGYRIILK